MDFNILTRYLKEEGVGTSPNEVVVDALKQYANKSGYINIDGDTVSFTEKGLNQCQKRQKQKHDWDAERYAL